MAILQISRITNRKGLTIDLPQLDGAELGWCTDSRRLFIGNGTLDEGAPVVGNTEILTEFSDITVFATLSDYTYQDIAVGYAAQTGPTPSDPTVRTVQAKLDDIASVRDFGAVGDGSVDDTAAINRALFQLYCRDDNSLTRRMLYFPAGTYRVTSSILIPSYAKLVGEGADCTIIAFDLQDSSIPVSGYVAQFADSLQQTGTSIGNNGAIPPKFIEISSMSFRAAQLMDVFLVDQARDCWFTSVNFEGSITAGEIADPGFLPNSTDDVAAVRFFSGVLPMAATSAVNPCTHITFDRCRFTNTTRGIATDQQIAGITVTNSEFDVLYQGIVLDALVIPPITAYQAGATGFRAVHNIFNNVYREGIVYGSVNLNVSAYNIFYEVATEFGSQAAAPVIEFGYDNNISVGDMFTRTDSESVLYYPRIQITGTATDTGSGIQLGRFYRDRGRTFTVVNNTADQLVYEINSLYVRAFSMNYTMIQGVRVRTGILTVVTGTADDSTPETSYVDDYTENFDLDVTLVATKSGDILEVSATAGNSGINTLLTYSVSHLA
jgi:hypothetical protein